MNPQFCDEFLRFLVGLYQVINQLGITAVSIMLLLIGLSVFNAFMRGI